MSRHDERCRRKRRGNTRVSGDPTGIRFPRARLQRPGHGSGRQSHLGRFAQPQSAEVLV